MSSSPLLVHQKIWLDKPKYDAAEKRYYERLAQSSETAKVMNSSIVSDQQDNSGLIEGLDVEANLNNSCSMSDQVSPTITHHDKLNESEDTLTKSQKTEVSSPKNKDDNKPCCATKHDLSNLDLKEDLCCTLVHRTPKVQDVSSKQAEMLPNSSQRPKSVSFDKQIEYESKATQAGKLDAGSKHEKHKKSEILANVKVETGDIACSKIKGHSKAKVADDKGSYVDPVSDVMKLKGFYLPLKNVSCPSESPKNKGTNVNTIPEISKITSCYEKSKHKVKKAPLAENEDSIDLIPSDSNNDPQAEDQAKKESKKKKKHKKERSKDKKGVSQNTNSWNSLAGEVAKARQHIKNSLQCIDDIAVTSNTVSVEITNRLSSLEKENADLKNHVIELVDLLKKMDIRISSLEKIGAGSSKPAGNVPPAPAPHPKKDDAEDDDGVDLFGSDSEEEDIEAAKIKEQRLAEYAAKKAKKPVLIAKSNIILDVKPWDDETNMKELEGEVRKITTDGLVWGASKLVPLAYGIHKLQISCVVEDDKVSVDWLQETIQEIEEYVQSVDIAAFNKV